MARRAKKRRIDAREPASVERNELDDNDGDDHGAQVASSPAVDTTDRSSKDVSSGTAGVSDHPFSSASSHLPGQDIKEVPKITSTIPSSQSSVSRTLHAPAPGPSVPLARSQQTTDGGLLRRRGYQPRLSTRTKHRHAAEFSERMGLHEVQAQPRYNLRPLWAKKMNLLEKLPSDIRIMIWEVAIVANGPLIVANDELGAPRLQTSDKETHRTALLRVSRQVRLESEKFFYAKNAFRFRFFGKLEQKHNDVYLVYQFIWKLLTPGLTVWRQNKNVFILIIVDVTLYNLSVVANREPFERISRRLALRLAWLKNILPDRRCLIEFQGNALLTGPIWQRTRGVKVDLYNPIASLRRACMEMEHLAVGVWPTGNAADWSPSFKAFADTFYLLRNVANCIEDGRSSSGLSF